MRWSGATGAIARCKSTSTGYARKSRSVPVLLWTCGVKPKPKAVNKPSHHSIMHGPDKPGVFTTVSVVFELGVLVGMQEETMINQQAQDHASACALCAGLLGQLTPSFMRLPVLNKNLNGMITNDKFCCTRWSQLQLSWWRRPLRLRQESDPG